MEDFPKNYSCKIFDHPFTIVELTSVIRSLKIRSAPSLDRMDNRILSLLPGEYLMILLDILNHIFDSGFFSVSWQHFLVFLIPKSSPGKLWPISLTSCLLKIILYYYYILDYFIFYIIIYYIIILYYILYSYFILFELVTGVVCHPPLLPIWLSKDSCLDNLGILTSRMGGG